METTHTLADLIAAMETIAPRAYAGGWDNVGLLLQAAALDAPLRRVLLAIDMDRAVTDEAIAWGAQALVAYHPPIFRGLRRITRADPRQAALLDALAAGLSAYSPHTALDAAPGGVCDWLAAGLGPLASSAPIEVPAGLPPELAGRVGAGRLVELAEPRTLGELLPRIKAHLGLSALRLAAAPAHAAGEPLRRVAICPGAGGSLFEKLPTSGDGAPDLLLTGELRHHDVLSRVACGTSAILTDHTNTERGYLPILARTLSAALPGLIIRVSEVDRDPLVIT